VENHGDLAQRARADDTDGPSTASDKATRPGAFRTAAVEASADAISNQLPPELRQRAAYRHGVRHAGVERFTPSPSKTTEHPAADTPSGVALSLLGGSAALTALSKANARVAGVDRSWSSAAVGSGLGLLTGAALGAFLTLVVVDGPGFNKIAAALGGFVLGSAVAAPLWTLVDPLLLTPPSCRDP
jgi:hypothetical protein